MLSPRVTSSDLFIFYFETVLLAGLNLSVFLLQTCRILGLQEGTNPPSLIMILKRESRVQGPPMPWQRITELERTIAFFGLEGEREEGIFLGHSENSGLGALSANVL